MPNRLECPQVPGENISNHPIRQQNMDKTEPIDDKKEANGANGANGTNHKAVSANE